MGTLILASCGQGGNKAAPEAEFTYEVDRFEDISVLRYRLPAFEQLTAAEKEFIYYLSEAALCGRDLRKVQRTVFASRNYADLMLAELGNAATLTSARFGLSGGVSGQIVAISRDLMAARVDIEVYT